MYTTPKTFMPGLAVAIPTLFVLAGVIFAAESGPSLTEIQVRFKLDTRITQGMYMGDRWVSPPTFTCVGGAEGCVVMARVTGLDDRSREIPINPAWSPGLASMVQVSPANGDQVEITVSEEGQSELTVTSGTVVKKLTVKAVRWRGGLRADISQ
jgi:hypothetical protein